MVVTLQTQRCKLGLRMLIRVRAVWDTDWTSPDTNDVVAADRLRTEEPVVRAPVSQVLVGVVLALAVRREAEERQLLVAALQLQDFVAQVQAALRTRGKKNRLKKQLEMLC